jgi:hypothetical protein
MLLRPVAVLCADGRTSADDCSEREPRLPAHGG